MSFSTTGRTFGPCRHEFVSVGPIRKFNYYSSSTHYYPDPAIAIGALYIPKSVAVHTQSIFQAVPILGNGPTTFTGTNLFLAAQRLGPSTAVYL